jgi:methyltransferase
MAAEGLLRGAASTTTVLAGASVFLAAKALKWWAIATLGPLWSFRVLVLPGVALVASGPYRFLRHPNYLALAGEIVGAALLLGAPVAGVLGAVAFGTLLRRRIAIEERALGLRA